MLLVKIDHYRYCGCVVVGRVNEFVFLELVVDEVLDCEVIYSGIQVNLENDDQCLLASGRCWHKGKKFIIN